VRAANHPAKVKTKTMAKVTRRVGTDVPKFLLLPFHQHFYRKESSAVENHLSYQLAPRIAFVEE
jgi:hypothetical protein